MEAAAGGQRALLRQVLGWRVAAAVIWSVVLLPVCTAAFIVLSGLDPLHPVRWISNSFNALYTSYVIFCILLMSMVIIVISIFNVEFYAVVPSIPCSRLALIGKIIHPQQVLHSFVHAVMGMLVAWCATVMIKGRFQFLAVSCTPSERLYPKGMDMYHDGSSYRQTHRFPVQPTFAEETDQCLPKILNSNPPPLIKFLALQDLVLLSQYSPVRRHEVFSLSQPDKKLLVQTSTDNVFLQQAHLTCIRSASFLPSLRTASGTGGFSCSEFLEDPVCDETVASYSRGFLAKGAPLKDLPQATRPGAAKAHSSPQMSFRVSVSNGGDHTEPQQSPPEMSAPLLDFIPRRPSIFERIPMLPRAQDLRCARGSKDYFQQQKHQSVKGCYLVVALAYGWLESWE
ncbi:hypothetical protein WISP_31394 [Willisornis vidua]|uniref:Nucleoporin NDC1 n=1 Tax=Willisornis vidua TaxID=1566151 RepID=A0ABQ9DQZ5_9PASS|nr:hypothetical protein WISP_31394 [Willisornis vidua]